MEDPGIVSDGGGKMPLKVAGEKDRNLGEIKVGETKKGHCEQSSF